jgi:outer membrane protein assembly factor BamB/tRNA A-37 threonylcarbamoyl transferase component Bud32
VALYTGNIESKGVGFLETQRISDDLESTPLSGSTQQLRPGTALADRYLIQTVIGIGGMSAVYRARDLHFPNVVKLVAVKEMVNQARDELVRKTIVRNFEREANLLATLDHIAIPRIYDYFTYNERSYLILEYINGKDLEAILTTTDDFIPQETVVQWAVELCDVLSYLHNHEPEPIIFRDMKPSNVMISHHGHVVLVDFGIAKPFQAGQRGTMIGTEGYSPPEQYRGEANHLADIYALGATLHHMLSRMDPRLEAPFSFGDRPIRGSNPNVSSELEAVVNKALQYEPTDRFQTAQAMKDALLLVIRKTGMLSADMERSTAAFTENLKGVKALWDFACEDEIRGTPTLHDGFLYIGSYDNNLYTLDATSGEFLWKYPTNGGIVSRPAVYDGNVYFGSEDRHMHVISSRYGRLNWTYPTGGPIRSSPYIAESHAFIGSDDAHLHAVNVVNGRATWKVDAGAPIRSTPLVINELIYFGTESGDFYCMDYRNAIKWRFKAKRAITSSPIVNDGVVYFGSVDSTLYALDAKTGWVIWRYRLPKATISTPTLADDFIFIGCVDGSIFCVDTKTTREVWQYETDHQVTGSPVIYKDSLYCGSVDSNLYCLEYRTGRLRWKFKTKGPITGTPLVADDIVYIGSTDHRIYALVA